MKISKISTVLIMAAAMNASAAGLAGDSIDAAMIRTIDTGYGLGRITGYGLDAPFSVADGLSDLQQYSGVFTLNVDDQRFDIDFLTSGGWQDGIVLRLSDLDFGPTGTSILSSLNVDTNLTGYALNVGPRSVEISLGGTHFTQNTYFNGAFVVSSVPEPATIKLAALALVSTLLLAIRKTKSRS